MISPRLARRVAVAHKWAGLIVGLQVLLWTLSGLVFTAIPFETVVGERLLRPPAEQAVDVARVNITARDALAAVVEDRPWTVTLRMLGDEPVYEIRADIGVFLVSAETGAVMSPISEALARRIAETAWAGGGASLSIERLDVAPREAGALRPVWAVRFAGRGEPVVYVDAASGEVGPARTNAWRIFDFFWALHIMDYSERENFNHPLVIAASFLALSMSVFGVLLVVHRFTRRRAGPQPERLQ